MNIVELALKTHCLADLRSFYRGLLGFQLLEDSAEHFSLRAGTTRLTFEQDTQQLYRYHFAFNIPPNQIQDALEWTQERVTIQPGPDGAIVTGSANWQSKAVYFADPAGSIVEFIARERLPDRASAPFDAQSILNVSEIGLAFDDVQKAAGELSAFVPPFEAGSDTFQPMGDDNGLLILVQNGRGWYPTGEVKSQPLPVALTIAGSRDALLWHSADALVTIHSVQVNPL